MHQQVRDQQQDVVQQQGGDQQQDVVQQQGGDQQEDVPLLLAAPAVDLVAPALELVAPALDLAGPALDLAGPALVGESEEQRKVVEEGAKPTGGIAAEKALGGTTGGSGQSRASLG